MLRPTPADPTVAGVRIEPPQVLAASLSDDVLLLRLAEIVRDVRRVEADLVAHIAEVDERRLYLREACSSMFCYCVERLHLSEPETALRIVVARATRRHAGLLDMLRDGRLHLSGIALLAPHLDAQNREQVLARACHLSKRQIEELVAELSPRPDVPTLVRKLPPAPAAFNRPTEACDGRLTQHRPDDVPGGDQAVGVAAGGTPPADAPADGSRWCSTHGGAAAAVEPAPGSGSDGRHRTGSLEPLAPSRYRVQFTAGASLKHKLERLQVLMRTAVPDGDLATLIEDAVTEKITRLEALRLGEAKKPRKSVPLSNTRPGPRSIPAAVKRTVRERDGDRCAYVDRQGRRCGERNHLHFHHRVPHAFGGDRSPSNIAQFCRGHNLFEAGADFHRGGTPAPPPV